MRCSLIDYYESKKAITRVEETIYTTNISVVSRLQRLMLDDQMSKRERKRRKELKLQMNINISN